MPSHLVSWSHSAIWAYACCNGRRIAGTDLVVFRALSVPDLYVAAPAQTARTNEGRLSGNEVGREASSRRSTRDSATKIASTYAISDQVYVRERGVPIEATMSALGHKPTNQRGQKSTVVRFGPKADKHGRNWIVR